jgi:hypothetical protein
MQLNLPMRGSKPATAVGRLIVSRGRAAPTLRRSSSVIRLLRGAQK